ncbi:hypothetical protein [Albidovulum aquaemixtae]|nr:hypothetical protein [Defluviimonas aquaemixtae]
MDRRSIETLIRIFEAKKDAELMALAGIAARRSAIEARQAALDVAVSDALSIVMQTADAGALSAFARFGRLAGQRRTLLEHEAREAEAEWQAQRDRARAAFGRSSALARLDDLAQNKAYRVRAIRDRGGER